MSSLTAYDAFEQRLLGYWSTTPIVFENDFYELPDIPTPFVYVEIYGASYDQETMGAPQANYWIEEGTTDMYVMVPSGQGSRLARQYANELLYLFREQPISTLFMPEMSIAGGDPGRDFPNYWALCA